MADFGLIVAKIMCFAGLLNWSSYLRFIVLADIFARIGTYSETYEVPYEAPSDLPTDVPTDHPTAIPQNVLRESLRNGLRNFQCAENLREYKLRGTREMSREQLKY